MLLKKLNQTIETYIQNFSSITEERKAKLESLSNYLHQKATQNQTAKLVVICTHNSRRSHIGQLWLAAGASYYKLPFIKTFSGGTEATAFNPNAVNALQSVGFKINTENPNKTNPLYTVQWQENQEPYKAFSKRFEDTPNPNNEFAAIMVCSEADEGCPFVPGCDFRLALPFNDPKVSDGTLQETTQYLASCKEIGTEMLYVLHTLKTRLDEN